MRSVKVDMGGRSIELRATFRAATQIADQIADPMFIAREAGLEAVMLQNGIAYQPKFLLDTRTIPLLFYIGAKAANEDVTLEEMQEAVFEMGLMEAREVAGDYLALIVTPKSQRPTESKSKDDGEPSGE